MKQLGGAWKFLLLKILYYSLSTVFSSFLLAYLKNARGVSDAIASMLLMLNTFGAFAGQFFFGRLCDYLRAHKKVLLLLCVLAVPFGLMVYLSPQIWMICLFYPLFGACQVPLSVVIDTWFLDSFPGNAGLYGKMLAAGAFAYAVLSISYGELLDAVGYGIMPWFFISITVLIVLLTVTIPDASAVQEHHAGEKADVKGMFSLPLILFLIAMLATGICGNTYSLLPMLMKHVNGNNTLLGLAMSSSGVAQIPMMLLTGKLRHIPPRIRVAMAGGIYFIMVLCFAFGNSPWYLIFGACISGAAWGLMLPAYRALVDRLTDDRHKSTAQGLADATYLSLGSMLSSGFVSLTAGWGMRLPLVIISVIQIGAIALLLATHRTYGIKEN